MSAPYSGLRLGLIPLTSVPDSRLPLRLILAFIPVPLCLHPVSASFLRLTLAVVPVPSFGFISRACAQLALRLSLAFALVPESGLHRDLVC